MKLPKISKKIVNFVLIVAILDGIILAQIFYDSWKLGFKKKPNVAENILIEPHPLPASVLRKVSLGLNNIISDVLWLQTIQYYGGGMPNEKYRRLADMITEVTEMDSKFAYPYSFGLLVLPGEGFAKEAVALGEKAMKNPAFKDNWEIPYYLGLTEHLNIKDHKKAAEYLKMAADRKGAPEITKLMAGIYYAKANDRTTAYNLYVVVYKTTKNKYVKERAKDYLEHMQIIFALEEVAKNYKTKYGSFPNTLDKLVEDKMITAIPTDPLERGFVIDPNTGTVSDEIVGKR